MLKRQQDMTAYRAMVAKAVRYEALYQRNRCLYGQYDVRTHVAAEGARLMQELLVTELQYLTLNQFDLVVGIGAHEYQFEEVYENENL